MAARKLARALQKFSKDGLFTDAAAVAFYTLLSAGPLLVLIFTVLSQVDPLLVKTLAQELAVSLGEESSRLLVSASQSSKNRIDLSRMSGWLSGLTLLISSSFLFSQLQTSFNKIFKSPKEIKRSWIDSMVHLGVQRLTSLLLVFLSIVLALISLLVSTTLRLWIPEKTIFTSSLIDLSINFIIFSLLFWVIYRWTPDARIDSKKSLIASVVTSLLFLTGKGLIGFYLETAAVSSIYGAAGSAVVLLLWVYYSSAIIFVGADFASVCLLSFFKDISKEGLL